jgi:hypothetical protein
MDTLTRLGFDLIIAPLQLDDPRTVYGDWYGDVCHRWSPAPSGGPVVASAARAIALSSSPGRRLPERRYALVAVTRNRPILGKRECHHAHRRGVSVSVKGDHAPSQVIAAEQTTDPQGSGRDSIQSSGSASAVLTLVGT